MSNTKEKVLTFVPLQNKGDEAPKWINNLFDEVIYTSIFRTYTDEEHLNEISPVASITTQDEGGNEREFLFTQDQLTAFIEHLQDLRWEMMEHYAKITSTLNDKELE